MNSSSNFSALGLDPEAGGDRSGDRGARSGGRCGHRFLPAAPLPASGLSDHPGGRCAAGRQSRNDGVLRGDSTRAPIRPHCGHHRNELDLSVLELHVNDAAVRSEIAQHRCGREGRSSGDQCVRAASCPANLPATPSWRKNNPAEQPVIILSLDTTNTQAGRVYDVASSIVMQKLSQIRGVGTSRLRR